MSNKTTFFTSSFYRVIKIMNYLTQDSGTSIEELCRKLCLTRRSISRLLNTVEHKLGIPIEVRRERFGGAATYKMASSFIQRLSRISLPAVQVSFDQALLVYLLLNEGVFSKAAKISNDSDTLQEKLKSAYRIIIN